MKSIKYLILVVLGAFALASCNKEIIEKRSTSPQAPAGNVGAYFAAGSATYQLEPDAQSVTVTITRTDVTAAADVKLTSVFPQGGRFTVPSTIHFNKDQVSATFDVAFTELEIGETYSADITIDNAFVNPYGDTGSAYIKVSVLLMDWKVVATGVLNSEFNEDEWDLGLYYSELFKKYKFDGMYEAGYNVEFKMDETTGVVTPLGATGPTVGGVPTKSFDSGMLYEGDVIHFCVDSDPTKTFYKDNVITFYGYWFVPALGGGFGWTTEVFTIDVD